ncbi:MAG: formylglycine-generating enzyme family protein [Melioribacteraceae bacterium]|nr:formylglycine-generating enzyme family protein [Melioribacteraceae bacterium]
MQNKLLSLFVITIFFISCTDEYNFEGKLVYPPVATMQLGPSIFLSEADFQKLNIEEGTPVNVEINNKSIDLRVYNSFDKKTTIGLHKKYLSLFGIKYNDNIQLKITKISLNNMELIPKPIEFSVESYPGNLDEWKGYAFGAPHGDCDNETGTVVRILSEQYGIPSTAAYGCRLSYRGIWYDCNRPLMKEPKESGLGVIPERKWNKKAEEKYQTFQDSIWSNSELKYGERFKLFTSFHGHDLTVKLPNGKKIQRPVIEGVGVGFSKDELRRIKKFYYNNRSKYYENAPDLYFGNLPEDLVYEYEGIKLNFFYSGLGTRTYGTMRNDITEYALHLETPNSMRVNPEVQPKTAQLLSDIYLFVRDSIFAQKYKSNLVVNNYKVPTNIGEKTNLKGGEFLFGAPTGFGWGSEGPQHKVILSPFAIDIYEVTNEQYCNFLNAALEENIINIIDGEVVLKEDNNKLLFKTTKAVPFSEIEFANNQFKVVDGREYFPVVFVTYTGANKYALSRGERLPTEAEWEYSASWNGKKKYLYGNYSNKFDESEANYEDSNDPFEMVTFIKTTPVGYYKAQSPNGCKDMSGNVWEWTSDYYLSNIHSNLKGEVVKNPIGAETGTMKVIKGGAWNTEGIVTSTTKRLGINPNTALINLGFRCVKVNKQ